METMVPLRRSKREKRLVFASLNQSEMYRHLSNPHYPLIDEYSEVWRCGGKGEGGREKRTGRWEEREKCTKMNYWEGFIEIIQLITLWEQMKGNNHLSFVIVSKTG